MKCAKDPLSVSGRFTAQAATGAAPAIGLQCIFPRHGAWGWGELAARRASPLEARQFNGRSPCDDLSQNNQRGVFNSEDDPVIANAKPIPTDPDIAQLHRVPERILRVTKQLLFQARLDTGRPPSSLSMLLD